MTGGPSYVNQLGLGKGHWNLATSSTEVEIPPPYGDDDDDDDDIVPSKKLKSTNTCSHAPTSSQ